MFNSLCYHLNCLGLSWLVAALRVALLFLTPARYLRRGITNPAAQGQIKEGQEYYLDIIPAEGA